MATCRVCDREFVYDDDHGYSRDVCSPICDGIEIGIVRGKAIAERQRNLRRFDLVQVRGCGELIGEMHEVADGEFVKYADAANLLDTIKACLVAAGGSENDDELEKQCYMAGTKLSKFVAAQFHGFQTCVKNLRFLTDLLPRLIARLSETDQAMFVVACREAKVSTCFCGAHWSQVMDWKPAEAPAAIQTWACGCGAVNGVNLATCRVCNRKEGER